MKKKNITSVLALICIFALITAFFTGCAKVAAESSTETNNENVISARIVTAKDGNLLITSNSGLYFISAEKGTAISKNGKSLNAADLKPGMDIQIVFDGMVLETYPAQIPNVETIKITAENDDKISLYEEAAKHIFEERADKDFEKSKIETVALDLTGLSDLSKEEKSALEYVLRNYFYSECGADTIRSNYDELQENGRITKGGEFKNGVIISVATDKAKGFSLSLVRSVLCGYGYTGCTAKFKDGEWKISYGDAWIS